MSYRLSKTQVELVLEMLAREQRSQPATTFERVSYRLLQLFIAGYVLSAVLFLIIGWKRGFPTEGPGSGLLITLLLLYLLFSLLAICGFIVNLFHARRFRKRLRLLSRFGVLRVLDDPWMAEKKRRGFGRFFGALLMIFGSIGTALSALALFGLGVVALFDSSWELVPLGLVIFTVLMTSLLLIGYYFLRRARLRHQLVAEAGRLRRILESALEEDHEGVVLDAKTRRELAAIERAQIRRSRAEAIQKSLTKQGQPAFAILKSQKVIEQQAELEPQAALAVEYAIHDLASDPRPDLAQPSDDERVLVLPVPNTSSELVYEVDDEAQRIFVHQLTVPDQPQKEEDLA